MLAVRIIAYHATTLVSDHQCIESVHVVECQAAACLIIDIISGFEWTVFRLGYCFNVEI